MTEDLSFAEAVNDLNGLHAQTMSIIKSRKDFSHPAFHAMVRDHITPNLPLLTPKIVECIQAVIERDVGCSQDRKLVEDPLLVFQAAITSASTYTLTHCSLPTPLECIQPFIFF